MHLESYDFDRTSFRFLPCSFIILLDLLLISLKSSAKTKFSVRGVSDGRSFMQMKKSRGPKIDPCDTASEFYFFGYCIINLDALFPAIKVAFKQF